MIESINRVILASDHGGYELKQEIIKYLTDNNIEFKDVGCDSNESCDYPDFAHLGGALINPQELGIFICGSGNGINMAANSHKQIRSALCWIEETASLARLHNNANIMCLPGRFISTEEAIKCVDVFLNTEFEGGRHLNRINKIKHTGY
jgi:ribose 5-phosphate isomerase B